MKSKVTSRTPDVSGTVRTALSWMSMGSGEAEDALALGRQGHINKMELRDRRNEKARECDKIVSWMATHHSSSLWPTKNSLSC